MVTPLNNRRSPGKAVNASQQPYSSAGVKSCDHELVGMTDLWIVIAEKGNDCSMTCKEVGSLTTQHLQGVMLVGYWYVINLNLRTAYVKYQL